jgi:NADH-quinone oxidoreductase subunit J
MDFIVGNFAQILFYVLAVLTIAGGIGVITLKNPVHAALALLWTFLMVAVLFILRHAEFLAAVQVLVYVGGILVLFLFVIMLVNVKGLDPDTVFLSRIAPLAVLAGIAVGLILMVALLIGTLPTGSGDLAALQSVDGENVGNTEAVGMLLYTRYLVPFEIVSVVLLVAMIAAIIFGRREAALSGEADR